jgi:NitT/TauT family transport system permease protein
VLRGAAGTGALLVLAELAGRSGLFDTATVPPVSSVLVTAAGLLADPEFLAAAAATLAAWAIGLAVTVSCAVPLGVVLGGLPLVERAVRPFVEFLRPIPSIALIPLLLPLLQDNTATKVGVVVYAGTWPVLINTMYAIRDVDPQAKETLRSFGFGPLAVLRRVSVPSAAPFVLTGVRLAAAVGLIVAISTELLMGGADGVGTFLLTAGSAAGGTGVVLATAVWAGAVGLLVNASLVRAGHRLFPWHHATTGQGGSGRTGHAAGGDRP